MIRTAPFRCPTCDHLLDAHRSVDDDRTPAPGDLSLCAYCSAVLAFDEARPVFRLATAAELADLDVESRAALERAQHQVRRFQAARRSP